MADEPTRPEFSRINMDLGIRPIRVERTIAKPTKLKHFFIYLFFNQIEKKNFSFLYRRETQCANVFYQTVHPRLLNAYVSCKQNCF